MNIHISLLVREFGGMIPNIKAIRTSKGLMQKYCAEKAGISQQLWSAYESGNRFPRIDTAIKIAKVLGVNVNDLYEVDNDG